MFFFMWINHNDFFGPRWTRQIHHRNFASQTLVEDKLHEDYRIDPDRETVKIISNV